MNYVHSLEQAELGLQRKQSEMFQHSRTGRIMSMLESRVNCIYRRERVNYVYTGEQSELYVKKRKGELCLDRKKE